MKKIRIDVLVTDRGFFDSREKAKRAIMAGIVIVNGQMVDKPGTDVPEDAEITIKENPNKYVSRGGLKLEKAMQTYDIHLEDKVCMDIGASTGGFTDCMLKSGAAQVFSVDVGYGQLDYSLRTHPRVVNMERTNIRHVTLEQIGTPIDFVSIDVSFISLKIVLPVAMSLMADESEIVFLIKPQFEAGREQVGKNGVVRETKVHVQVLKSITTYAAELGFILKALTFSPIKGPKGNIEFLCYAQKNTHADPSQTSVNFDIEALVKQAHLEAE
jgi:23S rRNA (cytidine1920-2'-O)/16S rRNA (cytidine1409-2'-O)-methyltransferase